MKKILIIGSSGLFGSYLKKNFKYKNHQIIYFKRNLRSNLNNRTFCTKYLLKNNFDVIINLAAITNIDYCEKNKKIAYQTNFELVKNLCNIIDKNSLSTYLIQFSTDQFYNNYKKNFENHHVCVNYYAQTKLLAEKSCLKINSIILRTNFSGKSNAINRVSFSDWIFKSIKKNKKIYLADDILFNPLSFQTLKKVILKVLKKRVNGIFNVGSKKGFSKYKFGVVFAKKLNLNLANIIRVKYKDIKFLSSRNKDMRMRTKRFEEKFNFKLNNLENEINIMCKDYKI
tara:strand:+ start:3710 stop:4564 length:855 start_codon:yes stop_codon:yes gene_type:complete